FAVYFRDTIYNNPGDSIYWSNSDLYDFSIKYLAKSNEPTSILPNPALDLFNINLPESLIWNDTISVSFSNLPSNEFQISFPKPDDGKIQFVTYNYGLDNRETLIPRYHNDSISLFVIRDNFFDKDTSITVSYGDTGMMVKLFTYDSAAGSAKIISDASTPPLITGLRYHIMIALIKQQGTPVNSAANINPYPNPWPDKHAPGNPLIIPIPSKFTDPAIVENPDITLSIYTLSGRHVITLGSDAKTRLNNIDCFEWKGKNGKKSVVASGIYYYIIKSKEISDTYMNKIMVLR
ncbi:MAG: hypothetical protein ABIA63_09445, partial [bacterium]